MEIAEVHHGKLRVEMLSDALKEVCRRYGEDDVIDVE
jgi:hypothetical protein